MKSKLTAMLEMLHMNQEALTAAEVNGLADRAGVKPDTVRDRWRKMVKGRIKGSLKIEEGDGNTHMESNSETIRTVAQLLAVSKVDMTKHRIIKKVVNKWDMAGQEQWQVKVWLAPIDENEISIEDLRSILLKTMLTKAKVKKA